MGLDALALIYNSPARHEDSIVIRESRGREIDDRPPGRAPGLRRPDDRIDSPPLGHDRRGAARDRPVSRRSERPVLPSLHRGRVGDRTTRR